jgi:hypothetical protein
VFFVSRRIGESSQFARGRSPTLSKLAKWLQQKKIIKFQKPIDKVGVLCYNAT